MSDVIGIRVKCPECGATAQASSDIVKCGYCGTESRVQRRTVVLQRPIQLPPVQGRQPQPIAVQRRSNTAILIIVAIVISAFGMGAAQLMTARARTPTSSRAIATPAPPAPIILTEWETEHPLIIDVDGDGTEDAIGFTRLLGDRDEMHLTAVSGRTGKPLWETASLGTYDTTYRSVLALVEGHIVYGAVDNRPQLAAYDAKTGKQQWTVTPAEVVADFCRDRDGAIEVIMKDEVAVSVDVATGGSTPIAKKTKCVAVPSNVLPPTDDRFWNLEIPGMQRDSVDGEGSSLIVSGYKSPGTAIPMLAVIDDHRHVTWKTELASTDPMGTKRLSFQRPVYDATTIVTSYGFNDDKRAPMIVAFDRATGTRLFETKIQCEDPDLVRSANLSLGPTTIWVGLVHLQAYDRKTGALRWAH